MGKAAFHGTLKIEAIVHAGKVAAGVKAPARAVGMAELVAVCEAALYSEAAL